MARGFTGQTEAPDRADQGRHQHKGFALIDVFSPCVTFNHDNTYEFFKQRTCKLEDRATTRPTSTPPWSRATSGATGSRSASSGSATDLPALDQLEPVLAEGGPLAHRPLGVAPDVARALIEELM